MPNSTHLRIKEVSGRSSVQMGIGVEHKGWFVEVVKEQETRKGS